MKQVKTFSRRNFKIPLLKDFWWDFRDALNYQILFQFPNSQAVEAFPADGDKFWHQDDKLHRTDGPAIECANGAKFWYQNGKLHRTNGPTIEYANGDKLWYQNGEYHRTDGPAIERANGTKEWWQNDNLHRTDGPAVEYADGTRFWYLEGKKLSEEEFLARMNSSCAGKIVEIEGKKYRLEEEK